MEIGYITILFVIIIIVNIIIRHVSDIDRPVSISSNNLFKDVPSRLRPLFLNFFIIFVDKVGVPAVLMETFISIDFNRFYPLFLRVQIFLPRERTGRASAIYNFVLEICGTTLV